MSHWMQKNVPFSVALPVYAMLLSHTMLKRSSPLHELQLPLSASNPSLRTHTTQPELSRSHETLTMQCARLGADAHDAGRRLGPVLIGAGRAGPLGEFLGQDAGLEGGGGGGAEGDRSGARCAACQNVRMYVCQI